MRNPTTSKTWNVGNHYDIYVIDDRLFGACIAGDAQQHSGCDSTLYTLRNRTLMVCSCSCHSDNEQPRKDTAYHGYGLGAHA